MWETLIVLVNIGVLIPSVPTELALFIRLSDNIGRYNSTCGGALKLGGGANGRLTMLFRSGGGMRESGILWIEMWIPEVLRWGTGTSTYAEFFHEIRMRAPNVEVKE